MPWTELCDVIEPHYPRVGNGRPPVGLQRMLRMYFVQQWLKLADAACEDALRDSPTLRRFVGIDLGRERVPDATTLLKFRRLLEKYNLGEALFAQVGAVLQARGLKVGTGRVVDATIIGAPSSTKNADKQRDPEMHQTRKGQQWFFGMKLHIGVDSQTGLAHRVRQNPGECSNSRRFATQDAARAQIGHPCNCEPRFTGLISVALEPRLWAGRDRRVLRQPSTRRGRPRPAQAQSRVSAVTASIAIAINASDRSNWSSR